MIIIFFFCPKKRASYGTTKYCTNFLRGIACTNPDCLYLHEFVEKEATFTKEEMLLGFLFLDLFIILILCLSFH